MPKIDDIVKEIKKSIEDYSQLKRGYPNAQKFLESFVENVRKVAPPDPMDAEKSREFAMNRAFDIPGGLAATFIGPKAATWNAEKAAKATKLLDEGADPAQVWKEHLIGRMPDGKLFSEIDDSKSVTQGLGVLARSVDKQAIEQGAPKGFPNWVWMNHDDLYKNYPELKDIYINPTSSIDSFGSFDPATNMMNLSALGKDSHSTTLHELQHAIQQREGWARGGSPEQFINQDFKRLLETQKNLRNRYKTALETGSDPYGTNSKIEQLKEAFDEANNAVNVYKQTSKLSPLEAYNRLTGEAQARATQDRINMNMQQRRDNYPLGGGMLSDIPLSDLIYRYGDNGPAMAIDAYHGSPHKFDAFDMSKIGSGEGNRAQGEGIYFAQDPNNTRRYAEGFGSKYKKDGGNIYKVSLEWPDKNRELIEPLSEAHLLDYDKKLSDQSDYVRPKIEKIIQDLGIDPYQENPTGKRLIDAMFEEDLKKYDIPGLRFDAPGEKRGDTSNYVIFDDKIPKIVEINGKGMLAKPEIK